jgi:hypothetical protein
MEVTRMTIVKRARMAATAVVVAGLLTAIGSQSALGAEPMFGKLFLNGQVVGTVIPPAEVAFGSGRDPFYKVMGNVSGQLGVAGVGPGEPGYHGGDWQVFIVDWKTTPYLLTSKAAVLSAEMAGNVKITRLEGADFRCPITSTAVGG